MGDDPTHPDRMYRRLEVPPDASVEQIRRAYRKLAHDVHPDAHPEDSDASRRFREITEAYEVLSDPERRARYDRNRQPLTPDSSRPRRPEAGQPVSCPRIVVGLGPLRTGSPPLIAGPVHIASPPDPGGAAPNRTTGSDLAELVEALLLQPWRLW